MNRVIPRRTAFDHLLLVAALLLCGCSLLTLFSAPQAVLWIVALLVGECGYYVAIVALVLAVVAWRRRRPVSAALATVAAILCYLPVMRAETIAGQFDARCTAAFGAAPVPLRPPFSFATLFSFVSKHGVDVSVHDYTSNGSKPLRLDLYRNLRAPAPQPIVILVHGGAWKGGKRSELAALNYHLAQEGYAVAAIDYRHAPKTRSPGAVDDLFRALDYLKQNAAALQLDPTRIAFIGRSAGGQIALSAAYSGREPNVRAVAAFYAPSDLVLGYNEPSRPGVLDSRKVLEDYLGGSPTQNPRGYAEASAINFVNATTPPTLLVHGLLDPIVWPKQSEQLAARLRDVGRPHLLVELPWATHGCEANPNGPSGQLSFYATDRLLAAAFAR